MLISEFQNLTGIYPSENLYSVIEKFYNEFKEDKHEFCEKYKEQEDGTFECTRCRKRSPSKTKFCPHCRKEIHQLPEVD